MAADSSDSRWGGYVPWFLCYPDFSMHGNLPTFFSRLSQRLERLFKFNECDVNLKHFGPWLESESLQRFKYDPKRTLDANIFDYFRPETLEGNTMALVNEDKEEREAFGAEQGVITLENALHAPFLGFGSRSTFEPLDRPKAERDLAEWKLRAKTLRAKAGATSERRKNRHYLSLVNERLGVLESLFRILPTQTPWYAALIQDIRRFLAEAEIMIDLRTDKGFPPRIVPLDEPLLQQEVVDKLLSRLYERFPERAQELVNAYHDLLSGKDGDSIFSEAFKTLEQLARDLTGDSGFMFDKEHLEKHFSLLHGTIQHTLIRLAGHRGDKAGHGKDAPPFHEIRYLLFAICNTALLLLDYPQTTSKG